MTLLILGLVVFISIHSVRIIAPDWRENMIASIGENVWKGVYSTVSLISFTLLVYGYSVARPDAGILYPPLTNMYHPALVLMALSMIMMMAFNLGPGYVKQKFRHPFLLAIILWSIAHLWMNGDTASVILFGSFFVWALIDLNSALRRPKCEKLAPVVLNDVLAAVTGLVIFGLLLWKLHYWMFGVQPIV